jgi:hypothetical protein
MSAQKREPANRSGKNYIGLLSKGLEEQCAAETQSTADRRVNEYLRYLMAAMSSRRREAR